MNLDQEALSAYQALSPRDRLIARLTGAAELIATTGYELEALRSQEPVKAMPVRKAYTKKGAIRFRVNKAGFWEFQLRMQAATVKTASARLVRGREDAEERKVRLIKSGIRHPASALKRLKSFDSN